MKLRLTNTPLKKKVEFSPIEDKHVKIYVCGITPYDHAHIGHGRAYVNFDVLVRLLHFLEYKVTYVRNITDIDDKLINKAIGEGDINKYKEIADHFSSCFSEEMHKLNCLDPDHEPRVTECIPEIITFIEGLINKKHAYVVNGDVYFDVASFPAYGALSGHKLEDLQAGARVDIIEQKRHPADFALWKSSSEETFWKSPWGLGRPGWHIECSVMAKKYLGETIDIHGGGMDLIFPHHENEKAQSESLHQKPFAIFWLHNAFVNINKEKMSKSLGNIISLKKIFEDKDPMVLRLFYLQHHYRTPIDFSYDELDATQTAYKKLVSHLEPQQTAPRTIKDFSSLLENDEYAQNLLQALCGDLNTPKFLGFVFERLTKLKESPEHKRFVQTLVHQILGLTLQPLAEEKLEITPEIENLIKKREQARNEKNWELSDKIRKELLELGHKVHDKKI